MNRKRVFFKKLFKGGSLLLIAPLGLVLFSCQNSQEPKYQTSQKLEKINQAQPLEEKEKEKLLSLVKAILPQSWEILDIYKVPSEEKFLKKYLLKVYSQYEHAILYRFLWLTDDGKLLFPTAYGVEGNKVSLILPAKEKEYPLENLRWVLDIERIAIMGNLPITLTEGKNIVYLVWNPYCKVCFQRWKEIIQTARANNISIKLIPYHNIYYPLDNLYMIIYLLWKAQNEGLYAVLDKYYSSSKSFEEFIKKLKEDTFASFSQIPKDTYNTLGYSIQQINKILSQAKIFVVPTTVKVVHTNPTVGLAEGYVYVGLIKLK